MLTFVHSDDVVPKPESFFQENPGPRPGLVEIWFTNRVVHAHTKEVMEQRAMVFDTMPVGFAIRQLMAAYARLYDAYKEVREERDGYQPELKRKADATPRRA
jgi:hypothetical protein